MKTISQRELRNDNAEIMRGVEQGETYEVTRRGVPVARIVPADGRDELKCVKPANADIVWPAAVVLAETTADILDELRGDR
ncbi:hypothetical protein BJH93_05180 [Kocuria polaris]|nr:hypothetical protein [Kocuria polaris]